MKKNFITYCLILVVSSLFSLNFYSNKEDIKQYGKYGLFPENPTISKIQLTDTNWKIKVEGSDKWQNIYVPSCYNDPQNRIKKIQYKTSFFLSGENLKDKHYRLVFYGVNYKCLIKVNGNLVENQNSGYSSFVIDLNSDILNFNGKNILEIEVDKSLNSYSTLPVQMQSNGWQNYGGIFRDVFLLLSSTTYVKDLSINYNFNKNLTKATINISTEIQDVSEINNVKLDSIYFKQEHKCFVTISDLAGKVISKSSIKTFKLSNQKKIFVNFKLNLNNPLLWELDDPRLYKCTIYLTNSDEKNIYHENIKYFGLRKIEIIGNKIYLNNNILNIKGVSRWEDVGKMGNAITYSKMESDIKKIKKLGANLIYNKHSSPHPYFLDLCDRYGILILQELPILSIPNPILQKKEIIELSKQIITKIIDRDKLHPSFLGIGLGEGYNIKNLKSIDPIIRLNDFVKEKTNNLLTFITINNTFFKEFFRITDITLVDFSKDLVNQKLPINSPIIISNIGSQTKEHEINNEKLNTETLQAQDIQKQLKLVEKINNSGIIISSLRDHNTAKPQLAKNPEDNNYLFSNGLISYDEKLRIAYRVVKTYFKDHSYLMLSPDKRKEESTNTFFFVGSFLIIIFLYIIKIEHYFRINYFRFLKNPTALIIDIRDKRISQVWHPLFLAILTSAGLALNISSIFWQQKENFKFDFLASLFINNNFIKEILINLTWNSYNFILLLTIIALLFFVLQGIYLKALSYFFGVHKLPFPVCIQFALWNSSLLLPMLFIGTFLIRILDLFNFLPVLGVLFLTLLLWHLFRYLQMMQVIYKTTFRKIIKINLIFLFIIIFMLYLFIDFTNNYLLEYLQYSFDMIF